MIPSTLRTRATIGLRESFVRVPAIRSIARCKQPTLEAQQRFDRLPDCLSAIATLTHDYPAGHLIAWHFHDSDQLVYASRGVMTVRTDDGTWVVPTHRAVWIPAKKSGFL